MANDNIKELSLLEVVERILKESAEPISIYELLDKAAQEKGIDTTNVDLMSQFYMDITLSGKFVFVGDDKWALKDGHLEFWDKDGYAFVTPEEVDEIDDEELDFTEFNLDDMEEEHESEDEENDEELDEEIIEEKEYIDVGLQIESTDEDDDLEDIDLDLDDDDDYDEDDYNDIMDDYEDMYDK
ncbi:MAG TPA: DNA-directed RNA polymerase subunit delta [Acholeplasma sp.]